VWALDARDGRELWRYFWRTKGGTHIGNRGAALWRNYLFFETPDNYLVSLDARTGKERWHVEIADFDQQYFSTMAPIVVGDHVLVGTGNDLDAPGFLQSYDPETGKRKWIFYTVPMHAGDPGLDTWPNLNAARHGGGQVWIPGVYDPETRLYIFGTGNPTPGYTGVGRPGDNLFTCSLVAVNVETGKMAWYFQTSPHDTHDWDSAQTPILIDGTIGGKPRKLVSTAARNGYFFTVDRVTGEHVVTSKYGTTTNWALRVRPNGSPEPNPAKEATIPGSLVSPVEGGVVNWQPPAFSPDTGLFYTQENNGFQMLYLTDPDPRGSMGLGGKLAVSVGNAGNALAAIDYRTGQTVWRHAWPPGGGGGAGMLTSAGKVLFTGDGSGNFVAFDATNGKPLWHSRIGNISNAPETYLIDGRQHVLVAVADALYAFQLY
jgi:alcohol dehydrogenase (cytochrome c)